MITVFLPCRAGSERVPEKNTKDFSGIRGGLLKIKLDKLLLVPKIDSIIVSTNDNQVIEIAEQLKNDKIKIIERPEHLALSSTSTDELINYVPTIIKEGHVIWTHVTSPFLSHQVYTDAIKSYLSALDNNTHDSLMTVNKIQTFLWNDKGSFNYDSKVEKWPRTQTLPELFEINSGMFINSISNYKKYENRIGDSPLMYKTEGLSSFDIDWPEDFNLAEQIFEANKK